MFRHRPTAGWFMIGVFLSLGTVACRDQLPANLDVPTDSALPPLNLNDASGLYYRLITNGHSDSENPLPWVIALHGVNGNVEGFIRAFPSLDIPYRVYVLQGRNRFQRGGYDWAGSPPSDSNYGSGIMESAQLVSRFSEDLAKDERNLGKPLVTGYSQGAILSLSLAIYYPETLSAAVLLSGWLPESLMPEKLPAEVVPIRAIHGLLDNRLPYEDTLNIIESLDNLGMDIHLMPLQNTGHEISEEAELEWGNALRLLLLNSAERPTNETGSIETIE